MQPNSTFGTPIEGGTKSVSYTGTAGTTAALSASAVAVRVWATTDCFVRIGPDPTATAADMPITAYVSETFGCPGGGKVSAIQVSGAGTIYATPLV